MVNNGLENAVEYRKRYKQAVCTEITLPNTRKFSVFRIISKCSYI